MATPFSFSGGTSGGAGATGTLGPRRKTTSVTDLAQQANQAFGLEGKTQAAVEQVVPTTTTTTQDPLTQPGPTILSAVQQGATVSSPVPATQPITLAPAPQTIAPTQTAIPTEQLQSLVTPGQTTGQFAAAFKAETGRAPTNEELISFTQVRSGLSQPAPTAAPFGCRSRRRGPARQRAAERGSRLAPLSVAPTLASLALLSPVPLMPGDSQPCLYR